MRRPILAAVAVLLAAAPTARAAFPWAGAGRAGRPATYRIVPGQDRVNHTGAPNEVNCSDWEDAATPEPDAKDCGGTPNPVTDQLNALVRADPRELGGVRGDSLVDSRATDPFTGAPVQTAWNVTTGRPDVLIAVLDSGIEWDNKGAIADLRHKVHLNDGELPVPDHRRKEALDTGNDGKPIDCSKYRRRHDANGDGAFNVDDYACDTRVARDPALGVGPKDLLDPEDLIIAFSDHRDRDRNGFVDDIAGWDFVDDDNDAYDDVQYGHGTGEARDSNAEADNGGDVGTCPNCMVLPLRVGESFVADVNRFAMATLYATDEGASVVQEALGTLDNTTLARNAIDYAYDHGVTVMASAADEAAQHHNLPGVRRTRSSSIR